MFQEDTVQAWRGGVRKAKVQLELNLEREVKGNKYFHRCVSCKRKKRINVGPLLNMVGDLATTYRKRPRH